MTIIRYGFAGVINSLVGFLAFLFFFRLVGLGIEFSNALGYLIGLVTAFLLNKSWVFPETPASKYRIIRFALAFLISYFVNLVSLVLLVETTDLISEAAQIISMASYTLSFYLLNRFFVFKEK